MQMPVLPPPAGCTQGDKLHHIPPRSDLHSVFSTGKSCHENKKSRDIYEARLCRNGTKANSDTEYRDSSDLSFCFDHRQQGYGPGRHPKLDRF
jgi:hypothetical protein